MAIKRNLSPSLISSLTGKKLFKKELKPDILKQNVFPTIRGGYIDFYYKGGLLFEFANSKFKTHIKYAAVISNRGSDYLTKAKLKSYNLATNFRTNYNRIKENCGNYSGVEALGVSELYHRHSYLSKENIVVLDVEVAFKSITGGGSKTDRIDILIYNIEERKLQFVEAKHYSNKEIWSRGTPKVIGQIKKYEGQIKKKKPNIIAAYCEYVDIINKLFGTALLQPVYIDDHVTLLIFGFDDDQKKGRLKKLIIGNPKFKGIKTYCKGDIKDTKMSSIWNAKVL